MAYFVKKSNQKNGLYLQICFSYRDPETHKVRQKCHKTFGYADTMKENGISDPISHCQNIVDQLNDEFHHRKEAEKCRQISNSSPERYFGYFPAKAILSKLDLEEDLYWLQFNSDIKFSLSQCLFALIYARILRPASKKRTASEILPTLYGSFDFNYDQIRTCLEMIGREYEKVIEIFSHHVHDTYILDVSKTYFDCTNYYFEIDREDEWRRKGPSKEHRPDPILGMGLLLDANCIPIGMRLYPGNCSEKPVFREVIADLKKQQNIKGRTVRVADKGLNCAENIYDALSHGDGYIFSKSIKQLPALEREWTLSDAGFVDVNQNDGSIRYKIKSAVDRYTYTFKDEKKRKIVFTTKEKRIVTYNPKLAKKQSAEIHKMVEKAKMYSLFQAKKSEYGECGKYVDFISEGKDGKEEQVKAVLNNEKIKKDLACCGYNMIISSEYKMKDIEIYNTYHELWRIEESFRTLKSELDARPVYLQTPERIKGHFLVCYLCVLIERLFQFKVMENQFGSEKIYELLRGMKVVQTSKNQLINLSRLSDPLEFLAHKYNLPLKNYYLTPSQMNKILERVL